jgi:hypothetical protein
MCKSKGTDISIPGNTHVPEFIAALFTIANMESTLMSITG